MDAAERNFLIHHLSLPPKLPAEDDQCTSLDNKLLKFLQRSLADFAALLPQQEAQIGQNVAAAIGRMASLRDGNGGVDEQKLLRTFESFQDAQIGEASSNTLQKITQVANP